MNFALSQRRTDRHPIGLVVVVGLHVLLAAVLLSARLAKPPTVIEARATLLPDSPKPIPPKTHDEPKARDPAMPKRAEFVLPDIQVDPAIVPVITGKVEPVQPPVDVARVDPDRTVHDPVRVLARAAHINAGAAQCRPEYPGAALRAGVTGVSRIRFSVDATGRISGSQILQSSGPTRENRLMDQAAAEALAQCPVQVGTDEMGRPVGATTDVDYVWQLNQ